MNSKELSRGIIRAVLSLAGLALVIWFLRETSSIISYILIAAVVSLIGLPLVNFLKSKLKFPNTLAVIFTIGLFLMVTIGLVSMFIPLIAEQSQNLSLLDTEKLKSNLEVVLGHISDYFASRSIDLMDEINNLNLFSGFKRIPEILNGMVSAAGSIGAGLFSVLFISFFFMQDRNLISTVVNTIAPKGDEERFNHSMVSIKNLLSRYFIGLIIQILILFILYTIVLLIVGVKNAFVIAFLCAILNLIPYIGPLIAAVLVVFLTMTNFLGMDFSTVILPKSIYVLIGYMIAQFIDNTFSQPIIFSKSVKSHPLEIFLVILIGGSVFGIIGMVLAIPSYTALKVVLKEFIPDNKIVNMLTKEL